MDLLESLRKRGLARNQKATVFQSLVGIFTYTALNCVPFSLSLRYMVLPSLALKWQQ
jgi:hypothetical protein